MCGIAGIFNGCQGKLTQKSIIEDMIAALSHRGPDEWGEYLADGIALGHTRLSIIDLSGGQQPMASNRFVISYNGEIYNYIELRQELEKDHNVMFSTSSDTEVVLMALEVYGPEALKKFNGQFAFIVWDKAEKRLIIARDRYGIRPLYILKHRGGYYFSSELKALDTIQGYTRHFDINNLFQHALLWNTLGDQTVYKNIRSLPGGTYEVYETGSPPKKNRYYEIGESYGNAPPPNINQAIEEFSELLNDSVRLRLRSDVPVATYLSGGIDSSVITYLTALHSTKKFKTFSVSFKDKEFDESAYQREMVQSVNSEHFDLCIDSATIDHNFLDVIYHTERPIFRTAPVPLYLLSEKVRDQGIKVVLTGEGADEILFGYDSYKELKLLEFWNRNPKSNIRPQLIKKLYPHLQHYADPRQFGLLRMYYENFLGSYNNGLAGLNIRASNNKVVANFLNKDHKLFLCEEKLLADIKNILPDNFHSWSLLQKNQFLEIKTLLSGYLLSSQGDRMSMAHSVEGRYPFLDHRVVEKLFCYPDSYKLNVLKQKYILGQAFNKAIPKSIINRPKRPYMAPDLKSFFREGRLTEQAAFFCSDKILDEYGIFDKKYVNRLINKFKRGLPAKIGYRDNMLITFILSCQMASYWTGNTKSTKLDHRLKKNAIED